MSSYATPAHLQLRKQPKQQRTRRLIESVFETTLDILNQQGVAAVNTNLIAEQAGIDVASLYQFFANKESILYLLAKRGLEQIAATLTHFEQCHSQLDYYRFFDKLYRELHLDPTRHPGFMKLNPLWQQHADFIYLANQHQRHCIDFLCRQLRRYGSILPNEALRALCTHIYYEHVFWMEHLHVIGHNNRKISERLLATVLQHLLDQAKVPFDAEVTPANISATG